MVSIEKWPFRQLFVATDLKSEQMNDDFCGGFVTGHGDVVDRGDPEQGLDVDIMGLWRERIPEKDKSVDATFRDRRTDLLISTQGAAFILRDRKPRGLFDLLPGGSGGEERVPE